MFLPHWVIDMVEKGSSMSECLEMMKLMNENEREKQNAERDERNAEREMKKAAMEHDMKLKELAVREQEAQSGSLRGPPVVSNQQQKLPKEGQDVDIFLRSFEKMAGLHKWPRAQWAIRLVPLLTGKALEAYARLSEDSSGNYNLIKDVILKRYQLTSEAYREKFRVSRQQNDESFRDYQVRTERYLSHWCERQNIRHDYGKLNDMVLREQLLTFCPKELQIWVHEHKPDNVTEVVELVEAYQVAHKTVKSTAGLGASSKTVEHKGPGTGTGKASSSGVRQPGTSSNKKCYRCQREGHIARDCPVEKHSGSGSKVVGGNKGRDKAFLCVSEGRNKVAGTDSEVKVGLKKYITGAVVKLPGVEVSDRSDSDSVHGLDIVDGTVGGKKASILRDTGSSSVFVHSKLVSASDKTGEATRIRLADGTCRECDEVCISLKTPFYTGKELAFELDIPFADVIVGNLVQRVEPDVVEGESQERCSAVQTRSQSKLESGSTKVRKNSEAKSVTVLQEVCDRKALVAKQKEDASLEKVRSLVSEKPSDASTYFTMKGDLLYRVFVPESGELIFQIVVPKGLRGDVLKMAHEIPMAGHLGNKKTRSRILQNVYWPGIFTDVANFCKSCPDCQKGCAKGMFQKHRWLRSRPSTSHSSVSLLILSVHCHLRKVRIVSYLFVWTMLHVILRPLL